MSTDVVPSGHNIDNYRTPHVALQYTVSAFVTVFIYILGASSRVGIPKGSMREGHFMRADTASRFAFFSSLSHPGYD